MARVSIEDCQEKLPNRFALVMVTADRTRQLMDNQGALVRSKNREVVTALREIAEGEIVLSGEMGGMCEGGDYLTGSPEPKIDPV